MTTRVATNLERLDQAWIAMQREDPSPAFTLLEESLGSTPWTLLQKLRSQDLILIGVTNGLIYWSCLFKLLGLLGNAKLVVVDLHLLSNQGLSAKVLGAVKRFLLRQVEHFILYFKDTSGYERHFQVPPHKVKYLPFKSNGWEHIEDGSIHVGTEYVLTAGVGARDLNTFIEATRRTGLPTVLIHPGRDELRRHRSRLPQWDSLPDNLRIIEHDYGIRQYLETLAMARLIVIPRFANDIICTGMSTYIPAMALGKCLIMGHGPGTSDLLTNQAHLIEPENEDLLVEAIETLWNDDTTRQAYETAAAAYGLPLQGEVRLYQDILDFCFGSVLQVS